MMGKSSRFYDAGYTKPKFMLPIGKSTLFKETVLSFKDYIETDYFIFTIPNDNKIHQWICGQLQNINLKNYKIVTLDNETNGQADTIFQTIKRIKMHDDELNIFNIDTVLLNFNKKFEGRNNCDGYIEVFIGEGDHWSFAEIDEDKYIIRTAEKVRISAYCSNGFYNFKSKEIFIEGFLKQKEFNTLNKAGEIYIAPIYNFLINEGYSFKVKEVDIQDIIFSGTPSEYETMLSSYKI